MVQMPQALFTRLLSLKNGAKKSVLVRTLAPLAPSSLLFLSLCLAIISLDAHRIGWTMWWAVVFALATSAWMLLGPGVPILRGRHLLLTAGILTPIVVRALLSLRGPLPSEGLHEAIELVLIASVALALWIKCGRHPARVMWLWSGAMGVGWISAVVFAGRMSLSDPAQAATGPLAAWGVICASAWFFYRRRQSRQAPESLHAHPLPPSAEYLIRFGLLAAGLATGLWVFHSHEQLRLESALEISTGLHVQRYLWLNSVLFGWGHGAMDRLIDVIAQPRPAILPPWGGTISLLAQGGMAGLLALATLGVVLLWRLPTGKVVLTPRRFVNSIAAPAALFLLGLMATGGPRSSVVLFSLAGWVALTMVPSRIPDPSEAQTLKRYRIPSVFRQRLAIALPLTFMAIVAFLMISPLRARRLLDRSSDAQRSPQANLRDQRKAHRLNSYEPRILSAMARAQRRELAELTGWSESAYQRITSTYRIAESLDPYNTLMPLSLAQYQLDSHREEEALRTVQRSLERQPNSRELINWVFLYALSRNQTRLANQMLDRGIQILPERAIWWQRRFELASQLGMGPLVGQAGSVSLTADPENKTLIKALWAAHQHADRAETDAPPAVDRRLRSSPGKPS